MNIKNIKENVQVEDAHIILGEPLEVIKYGKKFKIKQVLWIKWEKFTYNLGIFLQHYYVVCGFSKLPDNLNDIAEFRNNVRTTMAQKKAFKALMKMLELSRLDKRFIKKRFTPDDLAEFFVYVYLFNIQGVKKNFKDVLNEMKMLVA